MVEERLCPTEWVFFSRRTHLWHARPHTEVSSCRRPAVTASRQAPRKEGGRAQSRHSTGFLLLYCTSDIYLGNWGTSVPVKDIFPVKLAFPKYPARDGRRSARDTCHFPTQVCIYLSCAPIGLASRPPKQEIGSRSRFPDQSERLRLQVAATVRRFLTPDLGGKDLFRMPDEDCTKP